MEIYGFKFNNKKKKLHFQTLLNLLLCSPSEWTLHIFMYHVFSYDKPFLRKIVNLNVNAAGVSELILENRRVTDSDLTVALQSPIETHELI